MKSFFLYLFIVTTLFINASGAGASVRHPLEVADTSSPRATLKSFQEIFLSAKPVMAKIRATAHTDKLPAALWNLRLQSMHCLDLSQVPKKLRKDVGPESVVLLAEILSRIELPAFDEIPDAEEMELKERSRWRIPHTEITIARVEEGARQGEYLFSADTVARLRAFFSRVRDLPYRPEAILHKIGPLGGLYDYYSASARGMFPAHLIKRLPPWTKTIYFDHALWQWISMIVSLLSAVLAIIVVYALVRWWAKTREEAGIWQSLIRLKAPLAAVAIIFLADIIIQDIGMSGTVYNDIEIGLSVLILLFVMWLTISFGRFVADVIIASPKIDPKGIYAGLTKLVCNLLSLFTAAVLLFSGLSELGISLIPLLTGLGVGGLAVALAARPTIENLIGGLMILADRPYRVGQRIAVRGYDGIVQQIGLRSTKMQLLKGPQVTIPNEEMARAEIENISRRQNIKRSTNITIEYNTPIEKVEKAVDIIKDILEDHEGLDPKRPPRVYFTEFNPDSLNISMMYWYHPAKIWQAKAFSQTVNLKILQAFIEEGIKFAFPTTTTYLSQEEGQTLFLSRTAEEQ